MGSEPATHNRRRGKAGYYGGRARVYELPNGGVGHSKKLLRDLIKASSSLNSFSRLMQIGQGLIRLSSHFRIFSKCSSRVGISFGKEH